MSCKLKDRSWRRPRERAIMQSSILPRLLGRHISKMERAHWIRPNLSEHTSEHHFMICGFGSNPEVSGSPGG